MKKLRVGVVGVGHIGKNHARLYAELSEADFTTIYDIDQSKAQRLADEHGQMLLRETMKAQGFNIGWNLGQCAGAGVPDHLHLHIVPRWNGDTNFMPVLSRTRLLSESLRGLYDKLIATQDRLANRTS